ncbi:PREDICTED: uncharacterized protein LOC104810333 [Tarenaya hassleriana]|uniref:uncharacterized protein LOC104810333 n=1 Tax=Tarenaya hassleriana TaxID=28532 RepID=UPI00053C1C5B|nr:PREDICTED: uncharacterized protein LOC104810333 [Tarenaya hassleriana]
MATESISLKHVFFAKVTKNPSPSCRFHRRRTTRPCRTLRFRFGVTCSKTSEFQDFRRYAMPLRLLPAEEARVCGGNPSLNESGSRSLYKVKLQTSNTFGSGLSDVNARVLLCLIDEEGDSVLQTIPANLSRNESLELDDARNGESLAFQRGSVDEIAFQGPELGKIRALWISIESGQWRLGGVSLWVVHPQRAFNGEAIAETFSYRHDFEVDEILLGESSDLSMVELRPSSVTELTGSDPLQDQIPSSSSNLDPDLSEQSMKEYADLKFSLLLYDASLVLMGTTASSFSLGESSGIAFFTGGITGFLYLLLLQRSVDELPVPESSLPENSDWNPLGRFKIPALSLALAVGFAVLAVKGGDHGGGESVDFALTPMEILVGTLGFLACKVAVVLAAFKPLPFGLKAKK